MLRFLHSNGDCVHLVTAEVVAKERPEDFLGFPVSYTNGMRLPFYRAMTISVDWTFRMWRVIHKQKPDLIHVSSPGFMVIAAFFYSRVFNVPLVVSYHTHLPVYVRSYLPWGVKSIAEQASWLVLRLMRLADLTLVTSEQIKEQFLKRGVVSHCEVWQKGIDTDRFHPKNKDMGMRHRMANGHIDDFVMLYVGRIAKEKRLQDLREVLIELQKKHPDCRLCFVGTGPYHEELQNGIFKDLSSVVFLGELHGEELARTYASADCFVFPSDSETLGFVVLEAMASGLPVVAARAGGVPSLIQHGETSFLCEPGDTMDYAERIQQLKNDPQLRRTISERARHYTTQWDWTASMANLRHNQYEQAMFNFGQRWEQRTWKRLRGIQNKN